jgi:AhpD family alkylhydroperoxidase
MMVELRETSCKASPHEPGSEMSQRLDYSAQSPIGMKAIGSVSVYGYVSQCGLPAQLIDLVYLRVSQINGCAYCIDMHSHDLMKHGVPMSKILLAAAWRETGDLFDNKERAALQWAEAVTLVSETHVPDEAFQLIRDAFSEKEVADLTIAIGLMNIFNRMAISIRVLPGAAA